MTFLAAKKTYRYGDSIAYPQVLRVPAPAIYPLQHAVRPLQPALHSLQLLDTLARNYGGVQLRNTRRVMGVSRLVNEAFNCDFSHFMLGNVHGGKRWLDQLANAVVVKTHNRDITWNVNAQLT